MPQSLLAKKDDSKKKAGLSKFISKTKSQKQQTKGRNEYKFEGFYARLKAIDVKQSHSSLNEQNFLLDHLMQRGVSTQGELPDELAELEDDLSSSNFIQMLRVEKFNNKTIEFGRIYKDLENHCYSFPLLIMNKQKVIKKLISYLTLKSLKGVRCQIMDLLVSLIKDFRQDIYQDFMHKILPSVIGAIDNQDLPLLDKIFSLLSMAFKFLLKQIKDDISNVYLVLFELIRHQNKFVRKFASQSLSYVIRKLPIDQALNNIILAPLVDENVEKSEQKNAILGTSDLYYEVISGQGDDLHSKARPVLAELLASPIILQSSIARQMIRTLCLKLVNSIDTSKQLPIFEELTNQLYEQDEDESTSDLQKMLMFQIFNDCVQLKFGRRISQLTVIHMIQTLNNQKSSGLNSLSSETKVKLAETLAYIYYFKFQYVMQIFSSQKLDFESTKSIFTARIYKLALSKSEDASICPRILKAFFTLLIQSHHEIQPQCDLDIDKILQLGQSKTHTEFSLESHQQKASLLVPSFGKALLKTMVPHYAKSKDSEAFLQCIALFVKMVSISSKPFKLQALPSKSEMALQNAMKNQSSGLNIFTLSAFCALFDSQKEPQVVTDLKAILKKQYKGLKTLKLADADELLKENFVLNRYKKTELDTEKLFDAADSIFDLQNQPYEEQLIENSMYTLKIKETTKFEQLFTNPNQAASVFCLKLAIAQHKAQNMPKTTLETGSKLIKVLSANLAKNSRELRQLTIQVLSQFFDTLNFNSIDDIPEQVKGEKDLETLKIHYVNECKVIDSIQQFESQELTVADEKTMNAIMRRIAVLVGSGLVPKVYLDIIYNFCVGTLWLKLSLIHSSTIEVMKELFRVYPQIFLKRHIELHEQISLMCQIAPENDLVLEKMFNCVSMKRISIDSEDMTSILYNDSRQVKQDFIQLKDFHFNMTKALFPSIDVVLAHNDIKGQLFQAYETFMIREYLPLHQYQASEESTSSSQDLKDILTEANKVDSDSFKNHRKTSYSKLCAFYELLSKSTHLRKLSPQQTQTLVGHLHDLINSQDPNFQKVALTVLLKTSKKASTTKHEGDETNKTLKYPKYQRLLEGLADDKQYVDMMPVISFGRKQDENQEMEEKAELTEAKESKREVKSKIPRLEAEDRAEVLPLIIKLIFSKILKKRGSINKKSIKTRRNIVYQFMSNLDPQTEFSLFFSELLAPLGLTKDGEILPMEVLEDTDQLLKKLSRVSFRRFLTFIESLEVILKQLGTLLITSGFLHPMSRILVVGLTLAKQFIGHLKVTEDEEADEPQEGSSILYRYVGRQCKTSIRKGFKLVKTLYQKFNQNQIFMTYLSEMVYSNLVQDQLQHLGTRYISERSLLLEVLCVSWPQHSAGSFLHFPDVLPAVMGMLTNSNAKVVEPTVFSLHLTLVKTLVVQSLNNKAFNDKKSLLQGEDVEMDQIAESSDGEELEQVVDIEVYKKQVASISKKILTKYINDFASNLHSIWKNHEHNLKDALIGKKQINKGPVSALQQKQKMAFQASVKDLFFILSELSTYLTEDVKIAQGFLQMIVGLISIRSILKMSSNSAGPAASQLHYFSDRAHKNEQLLLFGVQSVINLLSKVLQGGGTLEQENLKQIFGIFLDLSSKNVREKLTIGLKKVLTKESGVSEASLTLAMELNTVKRGLADIELDFDVVLSAIQKLNDTLDSKKQPYTETPLDKMLVVYNIIYLVIHPEFSVRDFSQHAFQRIIPQLDEAAFLRCEKQLIDFMRASSDELTLKSILSCWRALALASKTAEFKEKTLSFGLVPLLSSEEKKPNAEYDDFFSQILSLQLKTRQKALRKLCKYEAVSTDSFREVMLPLIDYIIFASKKQMSSQRNTVRYNREQQQQLVEGALNVYTTYAQRLQWFEYFRLLRKLLFKLRRAVFKSRELSAQKDDQLKEKIIVKCICKILEGFQCKGGADGQTEVPDAVVELEKAAIQKQMNTKANEFSKLIAQIENEFKVAEQDEKIEEDIDAELNSEESEDEELVNLAAPKDKQDVKIVVDLDHKFIEDVQTRLKNQVLPVLQRHLTDQVGKKRPTQNDVNAQSKPVRSFVAVAVAKTIRKLPIATFKIHLSKLINLIVTQGLRSRDITSREKARKALVKVIEEVSPRFLTLIFQEMQDLLTKGYQLHVHLFTVHYILQALNVQKQQSGDVPISIKESLQPGQITTEMITMNSDLLLRELFGDLLEEKLAQDTKKVQTKESKARKAMPIFEVFAQYIDFKTSFMDLLAPIVHVLEENPNYTKVQQCEELLGRISSSLLRNQTLQGDQLLIFLFSIIQKGISMSQKTKINDEKASRDYGAKVDQDFIKLSKEEMKDATYSIEMKWIKAHTQAADKKTQQVCGRVLGNFGLMALKKALKVKDLILTGNEYEARSKLNIETDQELIKRLDPFVPLLLDAFNTYYNPIVVTNLGILLHVIHLGLPSFSNLIKPFLGKILALFNQTSGDDPDFTNSLFRCAGELIRTYSVYNDLSELQIKTLVLIIKANLASFQTQHNVFHCLKAIISRKFLCPDLYDLMENVQEMMIQNVNKNTRTVCAQIFVQFILEYPMESGRLEQHINYLVKNLGYFGQDGRLQLLAVFQSLIEKLPGPLLENYTDLFFFTLFLRLVNDENQQCREKVTLCLKRLIKKSSKPKVLLQTVLKIGVQNQDADMSDENEEMDSDQARKSDSMANGKLQLLSLFVQMDILQKDDFQVVVKLCGSIIEKASNTLTAIYKQRDEQESEPEETVKNPEALSFLNAIDLGDSEEETAVVQKQEETNDKWSTTYFAAICLEQIFNQCTEKHSQLLLNLVSTHKIATKALHLTCKSQNYWVRLSTMRLLSFIFQQLPLNQNAEKSCRSLEKLFDLQRGSEDFLKLNYQFIGILRYVYMSQELAECLGKNLTYLLTAYVLQLKKQKSSSFDEEIAKIFKKTSYTGRKVLGNLNRASGEAAKEAVNSILKFYRTTITDYKEDSTVLKAVCGPILELVYRTYTDDSLAQTEIKDVSTEIIDTLSTTFEEKSFFITEYNKVQQNIARIRTERKMKNKLLAATPAGPEIKARKRAHKAEKAKEKKKEKVLRFQLTK